MPRSSFAELAVIQVERSPGRYARDLGKKAERLAELEQLIEPTQREVEIMAELRLSVRRFVDAFRSSGRCKQCGHELEDPTSVARGVGPDCWERVSPERKERIEAWVAAHSDLLTKEPA